NLNLSTRPKKGAGKRQEEKKKLDPTKAKLTITKNEETTPKSKEGVSKTQTPLVPQSPLITPSEQDSTIPEHIEMKAPKLEGPKVIGKIELPINTVSGKQERKEKRKR